MKFAHMADCHIGSWRDPKLRKVNIDAFSRAIDICISKQVDFVLIAGDLFNNALPAIDVLKMAVIEFKKLKDLGILVYLIPGSHDYSPSGKTMVDVLENTGMFVNVSKGKSVNGALKLDFVVDPKTGAKITGVLGKRLGLDRAYYEALDRSFLESSPGFKIFLFHCALEEFKPKDLANVDSHPLSLLPKGFDYYGGGHVHYVFDKIEKGYGRITYPGPLFPNNFKELEELQKGGMYIFEDGKLEWVPIQHYNVESFSIKCDHKNPSQITIEVLEKLKGKEFYNTIVTLRFSGVLESGKVSEINFKEIFDYLYSKSAYFVMKNTLGLKTKEFEEINVNAGSISDIENKVVKEHIGQSKVDGFDSKFVKGLMEVLNVEREEDERVADFEKKVLGNVDKILRL